jgi:hypothetical protein
LLKKHPSLKLSTFTNNIVDLWFMCFTSSILFDIWWLIIANFDRFVRYEARIDHIW